MATYKTPNVYIEEVSVFPPSVAEVETAIPAFIGYTAKAKKSTDNDLILKPTKIYSLKEFEQYYGSCAFDDISVDVVDDGAGGFTTTSFVPPAVEYILWYSMKMFFDNGGGQCYITSVGIHQSTPVIDLEGDNSADPTTMYGLQDGLNAVRNEDEPTLIVIPEAVQLDAAEYQTLAQAVLLQCGELQDRFAVFDVFDGGSKLDPTQLSTNRGYYGSNNLKYGAVYYPFIKTTLNHQITAAEDNVNVDYNSTGDVTLASLKSSNTALYNYVKTKIKEAYVVLPPSSAVVGVYAAVDSSRGVWKAPANVSLANVIEPVVKIDNTIQDGLNVDVTSGKSINAIRAFMGKGTLVWGARTLAGNDNEWRYVPVRRFFNMVEESIKKSTYWAVFEPNDANTWVKVRGMVESYLLQKWRDGALAGAKPSDAYFVRCGLGITMDAQDILEGRMNVEIGMAVVRPAEFIILKFSHKLQTS
ncbi:phage tail sheath family protein [Saccharophagus degradans]|uniref:Phage tail sheath C-terminal domain-containing protein n=1 Tax=Saccharophagus degradans TaxID=86304 RepID=A0AAW7XAW5_9GAMM|nr:phage tail sheath C-terminal domain-containing protein [Saccharophagus degradans]MDO6423997.1 phage tail sheath C-terminal domain-containing protein [Saccharophagus degradans]MDO6609164.1 phage tail sheath C-terminal domain-containing protein [Saccharophagus degradans]